jgi:hypothetical protein
MRFAALRRTNNQDSSYKDKDWPAIFPTACLVEFSTANPRSRPHADEAIEWRLPTTLAADVRGHFRLTGEDQVHEADFNKFVSEFYRSGSPDQAADAIWYFVNSERFGKRSREGGIGLTQYFFARIAENHPEVVRSYEALLDKATPNGKVYILSLLGMVGDEHTKSFLNNRFTDDAYKDLQQEIADTLERLPATEKIDVLQQSIRSSFDLNLLWIEFQITGNKEPVRRIIQTLDWRDVIRENLRDWLSMNLPKWADPYWGWSEKRNRRAFDRLGELADIECDIERAEIRTLEDLDCICSLERGHWSPERFTKIQSALPFDLSAEELSHIAVKATAKWLLESNAANHELVLETCEEQGTVKEGRAELALLETTARAYLFRHDNIKARQKIDEYLERSPLYRIVQDDLRIVRSRLDADRRDSKSEEPVKKHADLPPGLPSRSLVPGVPFRSYEEVQNWERPDRDIVSSRSPASMAIHSLLAIIGMSLGLGFVVGVIGLLAGFIGPVIFTPEASQGPLLGLFLGPILFVIGSYLAGICQIPRALTLPKWGQATYALILLLLFIPFLKMCKIVLLLIS